MGHTSQRELERLGVGKLWEALEIRIAKVDLAKHGGLFVGQARRIETRALVGREKQPRLVSVQLHSDIAT